MTYIHSVGRSSYSFMGVGLVMAALALFPATAAHAHEDGSNKSGTKVEVNLDTGGSALVRGAKVTSVSGSVINATTNYGSSQLSWRVVTDCSTKFNANKGGSTVPANIAVGDIISFSGSLDQTASGLTGNAKDGKDW